MPQHARETLPEEIAPALAPQPASAPASGSPWRKAGGPAAPGARDLQSQLTADLYTGRLEQTDRPAAYSPMRGILIAAVPSAMMWWGIASLVHAFTQHR